MTRPALLLAASVAAGLAAACRPSNPAAPRPAAPARAAGGPEAALPAVPAQAQAQAPARLVDPEPVRYAPRIAATGTLKARQSSALAISVPGTLRRIAVRRGQEVAEGALLASLDDRVAAAAARQAEAAVAAGRAQLALAEDGLARAARIREQDGVSEAQLFQARSQRDLAAAQVAAAEAQLEQARVHLGHHHLRAPFAGVVTHVPDGVGVAVSPGVALVTLVATRPLVLETSLTQPEAAQVRAGSRVRVTVPATGAGADATVAVVVPAVDPATNRVPVEVTVPNPDGRLLPNAFARAELPRGAEQDAWRIPAAALVQHGGGYAAWTAGADGKARALPVRLLSEDGDGAVVVPEGGGWPAGRKVLAAPPLGVAEGALVAEGGR